MRLPRWKPPTLPSLPGWARAAVILAAGVVVAGVADFALSAAGHPDVGAFVWAVGYGGTVIAVWLLVFHGRSFEPGAVAETEADGGGSDPDPDASTGAGAATGGAAVPEGYAPSSGSGSTGERKH